MSTGNRRLSPAEYLAGLRALPRAFVFIRENRGLVTYCIAPVIVALIIAIGVGYTSWRYLPHFFASLWTKPDSQWFGFAWSIFRNVMAISAAILSVVLVFILYGVIAAPFNDRLAEEAEIILLPGRASAPRAKSNASINWAFMVGRALGHELRKLVFFFVGTAAVWTTSVLIPIGAPVILPVGTLYLAAWYASYDSTDAMMSRRQWKWSQKKQFMRKYRARTLGLGTSVILCLALPLFGVLILPVASLAGTILVIEAESENTAFSHDPSPTLGN